MRFFPNRSGYGAIRFKPEPFNVKRVLLGICHPHAGRFDPVLAVLFIIGDKADVFKFHNILFFIPKLSGSTFTPALASGS
jgi:hypothetical protein